MNIGVVSREYPPHGVYWGAATFYQNLAQALVSRGHQVQVICQAWDSLKVDLMVILWFMRLALFQVEVIL